MYRITCNRCNQEVDNKEMYLGQSGRSLHTRQQEHLQGLTNSKSSCPLVRHNLDKHRELKLSLKDFTMDKIRKTTDNMSRLISEAQAIADAEEQDSHLWNSKGEFVKSKLIRWTQQVNLCNVFLFGLNST